MHKLEFQKRGSYDPGHHSISVTVTLKSGDGEIDVDAKIDTGATYCIFARGIGESLGLDIESGDPVQISAITGEFSAFGHLLTLSTFGLEFESVIYFYQLESCNRNVLGRNGWLNRVRLGLVDYDGDLFISPYNE